MKYFISYTRRDKEVTRELLEKLSAKLREFGEVFVDILDNNSTDKQERVISELSSSDTLILLESKSIYNSDWVRIELEIANEKKIPITTISLGELGNLTAAEFERKFTMNDKSNL